MQSPRIRVAVADDNDMIRYGMAVVLETFADLELVGEARNGLEAIDVCRQQRPDVILMDLIMPQMNGVTALEHIHRELPEIRCIALTSYDDAKLVQDAIHAGAISYLIKNMSINDLADAIRSAHAGQPQLAREAVQSITSEMRSPHPLRPDFTDIERSALRELVRGMTTEQIAQRIGVDYPAAEEVISSVLTRLNTTSRTEAIMIALRDRLVDAQH